MGQPPTSKSVDNDSITLDPSVSEIRAILAHESRKRSTAKGLVIFGFSTIGYVFTFAFVLYLTRWDLRLLFGLANFAFIAALFVIGHDACHGSLTSRRLLNKIIGRLCFLPSYHPYSSWEHTHNGLHHGFTNVKDKDPVFAPLSTTEYEQLPAWRKSLERFYRTTLGLGLYYFVEIWWKLEVFPRAAFRPRGKRSQIFEFDRLLVVLFFASQIAIIQAFSQTHGSQIYSAIVALVVTPFILFHETMGFVIFLHHTHPQVPWYASKSDQTFFSTQVRCVVHAEFPRPIEIVLHNIMDHTAHHVDPMIPLYRLHHSQDRLERRFTIEIVHERWTLQRWRRILHVCRLYDYGHHQWLDFDGTPTTPPLFPIRGINQLEGMGGSQ